MPKYSINTPAISGPKQAPTPKVINNMPDSETRNCGSMLSLANATPSGYRQNCKKPMPAPNHSKVMNEGV
ncbi:hypothetical protein D3C87_1251880 [compost metagenome]